MRDKLCEPQRCLAIGIGQGCHVKLILMMRVGLFHIFGLKALSVHLSVFSFVFKTNVNAREHSSREQWEHVVMVVNCMCPY